MQAISDLEIQYVQVRSRDEIGDLFRYNGDLYRGINKEYEDHVKSIFHSGLLDKLIKKTGIEFHIVMDDINLFNPLVN